MYSGAHPLFLPLSTCLSGGTSPDTNQTLEAMLTDEALDEVAGWAAGVGLDKAMLIKWERQGGTEAGVAGSGHTAEERQTGSEPEGLGGSAAAGQLRVEPGPCNASKAAGRYASSRLLERLHVRGLQVRGICLRSRTLWFTPKVMGEASPRVALGDGPRVGLCYSQPDAASCPEAVLRIKHILFLS